MTVQHFKYPKHLENSKPGLSDRVDSLDNSTTLGVEDEPSAEPIDNVDAGPMQEGIVGSGDPPFPPDNDLSIDGQELLGPVIGATVKVYNTTDLTQVLCKTTTEDNSDVNLAGRFTLDASCVEKDKLYRVTGSGGFDIDVDDDGIRNEDDPDDNNDGEIDGWEDGKDCRLVGSQCSLFTYLGETKPKPVYGELRTLMTGEQLLAGQFKVSLLTEFIVEAVQFSLLEGSSIDDLLQSIDELAPMALRYSLNDDDIIDAADIIIWDVLNPEHKDALRMTRQQIDYFVNEIHAGENITKKSIKTYKELEAHVDTLSPAYRVQRENDTSYVATKNSLLIIDAESGRNSKILSAFPTGYINEFIVLKDMAFIAMELGLLVVDVSDPRNPSLKELLDIKAQSLSQSNDRLVCLTLGDDRNSLWQLNIMPLVNDSLVTVSIEIADSINFNARLKIDSNTAYVTLLGTRNDRTPRFAANKNGD